MSTTLTFISGGALMASLVNLPPETLINIFGCLFGLLCAVCAIYLYVLANQPQLAPQRRPVRRAQRLPATFRPFGQMALQGGVA